MLLHDMLASFAAKDYDEAMRFFHALFLAAAFAPAAFFASCAGKINGSLRADGSAELQVQVSLEPRMTSLVKTLSQASGAAAGGPLLDANAIAKSMSTAPGIASAHFENTAPAAFAGPVKVAKVGEFLASGALSASANNTDRFINFTQDAGGGRCIIKLNRENGPQILSLLSQDVNAYLEALMAPIATGENISKNEYLSLVTMVYGENIALEISNSVIQASIEFPGTLNSVKGGTPSGRRAIFNIPLVDLLVLETPLYYEAAWK